MDPDEALERLRELAERFERWEDAPSYDRGPDDILDVAEAGAELAGFFRGLDGWIMSGGMLPKDWEKRP